MYVSALTVPFRPRVSVLWRVSSSFSRAGSAVRIESDGWPPQTVSREHRRPPEVEAAGGEDHLVVGVVDDLAGDVAAQPRR